MIQRSRGIAVRRPVIFIVLLLVAVLAFPAAAPAARYKIKAREDPGVCDPDANCWRPSFRHILKGDVVIWKNPATNSRVHDLTAINKRKWNIDKVLNPGDKAKRRFRKKGTYKFRCTIHSRMVRRNDRKVCDGMCGVVHVGA